MATTTNRVRDPGDRSATSALGRLVGTTRRAFTLVELLVVIGIIAVLISILLPTLSRARESAKIATCLSNLRQMGMGIEMYTSICKGQMPLAMERIFSAPTVPDFVAGGRGRTWAGLLRDVAKVPAYVFFCPSDKRDVMPAPDGLQVPTPTEINTAYTNNPAFMFSYGVPYTGYSTTTRRPPWSIRRESTIEKVRGPLAKSKIKNTSEFVLIWDCYVPWLSNGAGWSGLKTTILGYASPSSISVGRTSLYRHTPVPWSAPGKGPNTLFADGHAEARIDVRNLNDDNVNLPAN